MLRTIQSLLMVFCVLFFASLALAGPLEEGVKAYQDKEYARAMEILIPLARENDTTAQFYVGTMYGKGEGHSQNLEVAAHWFTKASHLGHPSSQLYLGTMYYHGRGVKKDLGQACAWWIVAAARGNERAGKFLNIAQAEMSREQIQQSGRIAQEIMKTLQGV